MQHRTGETVLVPNSSGIEPPKTPAPVGAVDCHIHIFDPRFAFIPGRNPGVGTVQDYLLFRRRLGLSRCIVVAASSYGFDNSCLEYALEQFGDTARGVASVKRDVTDAELQHLHNKGVRGIRMNYGRKEVAADDIIYLAHRIKTLNWHLQTHMLADVLVEQEKLLGSLPVTLVIDHLGRAPQPGGLSHPVVKTLERLLGNGNTYVKLSHYYEHDGVGYADYAPLAQHLVRIATERVVWASDWPHGTQPVKPDDAVMFDQLAVWAPDEQTRRRILVDNPDALYWRD